MKRTTILMAAFLCLFSLTESPAQNTHKNMEQLNLTQEWDKTFPKSDKVNHSKVTFVNRYGITLAACYCCQWSVWSCKGTVVGTVCPDTCRTRIPDDCF